MRGSNQETSTPYCRCRVLYLGSSVPHVSKDGLLGCQEPLRELYPEQGAGGARGIDSWLSVWSNGLLLENVDENRKKVTRFFPIESLHYCAAVRHVKAGADSSSARFLPLDSPFAKNPNVNHPPLFAAILRRTTGIKVLECHAFICKRDMAANALVRCCFHAYADCRYVRNLEPTSSNGNGTSTPTNNHSTLGGGSSSLYHTLGGSSTTLHENGNGTLTNGQGGSPISIKLDTASNDDGSSLYNGDENHKVWARSRDEIDGLYQEQGTMRSTKNSRPRQLIAPPPPPPPPPQQPLMMEESNSGSASRKKAKNKMKKMKSKSIANGHVGDEPHHYVHQQLPPHAVFANGHGHHTLGHPIRQQQIPLPYHPHQLPPSSSRSVAGTLARPAPVLLVPAATLPRKLHHGRGIRPIPAAAPIVPMYAPMPVAVPAPPPVLYQPGYGTTGNRGRRHHHPHPEMMMVNGVNGGEGSTLSLQNRRMAASHADLSAMPPAEHQQQPRGSDSPDNDSRFGTGIYRRKGHLNERAFSYSIRAEHRSRSHGSLASLGFAGQNGTNGMAPGAKEDKKDREMAQMVSGLTLEDGPMMDGRGQVMKNGNGYHHHHMGMAPQHMPQPLPRPRR